MTTNRIFITGKTSKKKPTCILYLLLSRCDRKEEARLASEKGRGTCYGGMSSPLYQTGKGSDSLQRWGKGSDGQRLVWVTKMNCKFINLWHNVKWLF